MSSRYLLVVRIICFTIKQHHDNWAPDQLRIMVIFSRNPPTTTRVKISQYVDILCQGISNALKSQTPSNLTCSKYIYRSK